MDLINLTGHEWIKHMKPEYKKIFLDKDLKYRESLENNYLRVSDLIMDAIKWSTNKHIERKYKFRFIKLNSSILKETNTIWI